MSRPGKPLTRARSDWYRDRPDVTVVYNGREHVLAVWRRRTGDGLLTVQVGIERWGWHLSISFIDNRGKLSRYPRWDEIADARYRFCPDDVTMAMILPPPEQYVAAHDTTFHLHELADTEERRAIEATRSRRRSQSDVP